ncbi:ligase-associated DNA damage response exonuclease [Hyphobacterium sp. CCMP332]|nr:ligase-associated DNA damage response exonuclease [Hyphobacterium sp. CCMP332]
MINGLLTINDKGIYCQQADVYIDPWKPVNKAIITHAHSDHARWGMKHYAAHPLSIPIMRSRIGKEIKVDSWNFGEIISMDGVKISLHPAGHIPGSAQVRLEYKGEIWVVSGDYKLENDPLSGSFESIKCHHFITESTFGLPVYKWKPDSEVFNEINNWWKRNKEEGKFSIIYAYALGKSQRVLSGLDTSIGPILTHGAVENVNKLYRESGLKIPETKYISTEIDLKKYKGAIVMAPPSAAGSAWIKKFKAYSEGQTSGWMALRGTKRRRNVDRGFVLSDHADWNGLNQAVESSGAENIYVTHGYRTIFSKWLNEKGFKARVLETAFEGELNDLEEGSVKA